MQQGVGAKINVLLHASLVQEGHSTNLECLGGDNIVGPDGPRLYTLILSPEGPYVLAEWKFRSRMRWYIKIFQFLNSGGPLVGGAEPFEQFC